VDTLERAPAAGWYDDGTGQVRWWDGDGWTDHLAPASAVPSATPAATVSVTAAPEPAPAAAPEPLRPGAPDPVRPSAAAQATAAHAAAPSPSATPAASGNAFLPATSFLPETTSLIPGVARTAAPISNPDEAAARFGSSTPATSSRFGAAGGTFSAPPTSGSSRYEGGSHSKGGLIALAVVVALAVVGIGVFRFISGPPKPVATPAIIAAAIPTPTTKLPAGFTADGLSGGFKVMPLSSCASGTSCRTIKLASRTTCKRLSALVLFATTSGNRVGSDVIAAKNVKAGKPVALIASVRPSGGETVRVSSVVCQQF
jgi:hypothetical protein